MWFVGNTIKNGKMCGVEIIKFFILILLIFSLHLIMLVILFIGLQVYIYSLNRWIRYLKPTALKWFKMWYTNMSSKQDFLSFPSRIWVLNILNIFEMYFLPTLLNNYCNRLNTVYCKVIIVVQSNSVITNSLGPAKLVRYSRSSLKLSWLM
jgi:hypothetical protein